MGTRVLSDTNSEVTRIAGGVSPPVLDQIFQGKTRITGQWSHQPYDADVAPVQEHIIAAMYSGEGTTTAVLDGKRLTGRVRGGTYNILARGHYGQWRMTGGSTVSNVYLGHDRLVGFADQFAEGRSFELLDAVHGDRERLFAVMGIICAEVSSPGPHGLMFIEHAIDLLCFELLRGHSTLCQPSYQRQRGLPAWQVKRVLGYMRERQGTDISLQQLADIAHMSRFHFCTAFRAATGLKPFECLTRMRMDTAVDLLKNSPLTIAEIAVAVGYANAAAFSTAFRRYRGMSPRSYRFSL